MKLIFKIVEALTFFLNIFTAFGTGGLFLWFLRYSGTFNKNPPLLLVIPSVAFVMYLAISYMFRNKN